MSSPTNIQSRLAELGLYAGVIDGKIGDQTKEAIRQFQRSVGLTVDGIAGQNTQEKLFPVDAMPQRDIDPPSAEPAHIAPIWPRQAECPAFYGAVGTGQTALVLPFPMRLAWDLDKTVSRFSVHAKVHDSAARAFERIASTFSASQREALGLNIWGGCLNVRAMRGGARYSMHSWGIAIDFDPDRNQLKWGRDRARLGQPDAVPFWEIWEAEGWVSLGRHSNFDWMHVQAARL